VSIASFWEIAIKAGVGKLEVPNPMDAQAQLDRDNFGLLPIELAHIDAVRGLPWKHRDPFDRMLVAQALVEGMTVLTDDPGLAAYGVPTISASE
jgi:PIN domain nuclease of toxin-antitoxin system